MKLRLMLGSVALAAAMTVAPVASQAGGLHHLCPTHWLKHHHHHHHAKPVVVKKVYKKHVAKSAKPAKAAAKPMK
jgi:hypothetical protein